jgi:hypothetical protein
MTFYKSIVHKGRQYRDLMVRIGVTVRCRVMVRDRVMVGLWLG